MRIVVKRQSPRALTLTPAQFEWLRAMVEDEWQDFLKGTENLGLPKPNQGPALELLEVFKMLKLVSSDATLDDEGYLIGESEMKERVRDITRAYKSKGKPPP